MVAKAGLGLIGLSAISVGGVALAKPHLLGMDYMPEWHSLSEDNNFSTSYTGDTAFGKKYGKYLVGVTNKKGTGEGAKKTNESWWEWAYRRLSKDKDNSKSKKFKQGEHVAGGFITTGSDASKSLHKVCEEAYKKGDDGFHNGTGNNNDNKPTKEEVWKYCSIGGAQPQTIKEFNTKKPNNEAEESYSNNDGDAIAKDDTEKGKLLSIKSPVNDWIWDLKDKEFRSTTITAEGYFKAERGKGDNDRKTLKEICKDAYSKKAETSGADKVSKDDATKYCSLEQITAS